VSDNAVTIRLDQETAAYTPGDTLSGRYEFSSRDTPDAEAVEVSVLWFTDGKGDEDLGVHHFERHSAQDTATLAAYRDRRFLTRLPNSPLSYEGAIVQIRWGARVPGRRPGAGGRGAVSAWQRGACPGGFGMSPAGNPFCTRRIRPGAVPFLFPPGASVAGLLEKLQAAGWWNRRCWPPCCRRCDEGGWRW
jgi:hypothetical protein